MTVGRADLREKDSNQRDSSGEYRGGPFRSAVEGLSPGQPATVDARGGAAAGAVGVAVFGTLVAGDFLDDLRTSLVIAVLVLLLAAVVGGIFVRTR
ncbi:hypothetical protein C5E45_18115 [Nocardia nova]|uniref:Uncharacterized protein n=1 Tax=Nocardia nova TaxID=37330 RepID=A0A2S6ANG9_9NOCA|nr:hypothetical protein [Nocardia nova]PPJ36736.1 hypothetical protein C5E45_18115 [Nocardia nova]